MSSPIQIIHEFKIYKCENKIFNQDFVDSRREIQ